MSSSAAISDQEPIYVRVIAAPAIDSTAADVSSQVFDTPFINGIDHTDTPVYSLHVEHGYTLDNVDNQSSPDTIGDTSFDYRLHYDTSRGADTSGIATASEIVYEHLFHDILIDKYNQAREGYLSAVVDQASIMEESMWRRQYYRRRYRESSAQIKDLVHLYLKNHRDKVYVAGLAGKGKHRMDGLERTL